MNGSIKITGAVKSSPVLKPTRDLIDTAETRPARYECFAGREFIKVLESNPRPAADNLLKGIAYAFLLTIAGIILTAGILKFIDVVVK